MKTFKKSIKSLLSAFLIFSAGSALALNVMLTAKSDGSATPTIVGKTNLPDGAELMFTLENKGINYRAQTKAIVSGGKFKAGPFSRHYSSLAKGTYTLEVSMSAARLQSTGVQKVIGRDGERLTGAAVKRSGFGGNYADFGTSIRVPATIQKRKGRRLTGEECARMERLVPETANYLGMRGDWMKLIEYGKKGDFPEASEAMIRWLSEYNRESLLKYGYEMASSFYKKCKNGTIRAPLRIGSAIPPNSVNTDAAR